MIKTVIAVESNTIKDVGALWLYVTVREGDM